MSHKLFSFFLVTVLSIFIISGCMERAEVDTEAEKEKIDSVMTAGFDAVEQQNWDELSKNVSDDWHVYTHMGTKWNINQMKDFFGKNIRDHNINITNKDFHFSEAGDFAWVTFEENSSLTFRDSSQNVNAIFTAIFEKENDEWEMVHLHRSLVMPIPMDTTKGEVNQ